METSLTIDYDKQWLNCVHCTEYTIFEMLYILIIL